MYTDIHSSAGVVTYIGITAFTGNCILGFSIAAATHFLLDFIMEEKFKGLFLSQIAFLVLFFLLGFKTGMLKEFIIGAVAGNLYDIIDKKLGLSLYDLKKHPYTYHFHIKNQKKGLKISSKTTRNITLINTTIILLMITYICLIK